MNPNTESKWFVQNSGYVQGPFDNQSLQNYLQTLAEDILSNCLVWKRGLPEWIKVDHIASADQKIAEISNKVVTPQEKDSDLFQKTFTQSFTEGVFYRVQLNFIDQPLMSKADLMAFIAKQQDVSKISIQEPQSKEWKDVYSFPDIVERLGLSRRKQARVPILAQFVGKTSQSENETSYRVITISHGGVGFTETYDLKIGDEIEGQITSPHFFQPIFIKAEVIYAGQDGYIGLKFTQIADEGKAAIIEYIKKFGKASNP